MITDEVIGIIAGAIATALGAYFVFRRGQNADDRAADNVATAHVYTGYGGLLERIEQEVARLRHDLVMEREARAAIEQEVARLRADLAQERAARAVLEQKLADCIMGLGKIGGG